MNNLLKPFLLSCLVVLAVFSCKDTSLSTVTQYPLLKGVNIAGAEFSEGRGVQVEPIDIYPNHGNVDHFVDSGISAVRLPFNWENIQPTLNGPLNQTELSRLTSLVNYITVTKSTYVIIDVHNYARYDGKVIGGGTVTGAHLADLWSKLALQFKSNNKVIFGLMNEPHDIPGSTWIAAANTTAASIRNTGATNFLSVASFNWGGPDVWAQGLMNGFVDPGNRWFAEAHIYFDSDSSGRGTECISTTVGRDRIVGFTNWLRTNHRVGLLGEFGTPSTPTCLSAITNLLTYMQSNEDVLKGFFYWASGPWWGTKIDMIIEPINGQDRPQFLAMLPFLQTSNPPPVDSGVGEDASTGPDSGFDSGAPTAPILKVTTDVIYTWSGGYCKTFHLSNLTDAPQTWSELKLNLRGSKIRDQHNTGYPYDTWSAHFEKRTGVIKVRPASWNGTIPPNIKISFGLCADYQTDLKWTATYVQGSLIR